MKRTSWFVSETVEIADQKPVTKPSREVQRLLRTAGPDRPDIRDLEDFGTRRTRGDTHREQTKSCSVELDVKSKSESRENSASEVGLFDFLGPATSPIPETMGNPNSRRSRQSSHSEGVWKIRCICGAREEGTDTSEAWIECDNCGNWQHNVCMGISTYATEIPKKYNCQDCDPDAHKELLGGMDSGERPWEKRRKDFEEKLAEENHSKKRKRTEENEDQAMVDGDVSQKPELFPLTDDCHHYIRRKDVAWDIQKSV